jgi:hypothetical protein
MLVDSIGIQFTSFNIFTVMTGAAIAISVGICLLFFGWQQRQRIFGRGRRMTVTSRKLRPQQPHLERKLLKLLGGNQGAATRLIQQSQLRHPDKSADWHWEKAIYDLERDRWR